MELKSRQVAVENRISEVATHKELVKRAKSIVRNKLGAMLYTSGEVEEIAADAVSETVVNLLTAMKEGTTSIDMTEAAEPLSEDVLSHTISIYIQGAVNNYCNTRLKRWSLDQNVVEEKDDVADGNVDKDEIQNEEHQVKPKKVGVRSRYEIHSERADDTDFWDQHVERPHDDAHLDAPKVAGMLADKGLKKKEIDRILLFLDGMTFAEMARNYGGAEGTYRHSIQNALAKIGLENLYTG